MKKNNILFILLFILSLLFSSCYLSYKVDFDETTFEEEYQLWKNNGFTDYSFVCDRHIYEGGKMLGKVKISVCNGNGTYEVLSDTLTVNPEEIKSIDDVYEYIKALKEKNERIAKNEKTSYRFTISYDKTYHYPKSIKIDENVRKKLDLAIPYSEKVEITDFTLTNTQ